MVKNNCHKGTKMFRGAQHDNHSAFFNFSQLLRYAQ